MSALSKLAPLIILFVALSVVAFIGYVVYSVANDVADKAAQKMEKRHMSITKDGMVVGVKEKREERYVDQTQSFLVKAWSFSTWPAYKSRLWNKEQNEQHGPPVPPHQPSQTSHSRGTPQTPQARAPFSRATGSVAGKPKV
ncbi:hypothetical protein MMC07_006171 [Pseudocyphellaria aurata]|nr:hypothetical protein [Pseudocyphellaria aurata]